MTTDNFCFYLQNRLIQTSQTGGQWYNDTSYFSIPWLLKNNWSLRLTPPAKSRLAKMPDVLVLAPCAA
jgi:hypothetical protein